MDHRELRFGYGAGTQMQSFRQLLDEAEWAHSAGFESFWLSQVFGLDPIVALAALGGHVPRFRELGTSVVPLAGRHPLALGAQARTAQSALDGRFTLGIGTSHQIVVEGFFGEPYKGIFGRTEQFMNALLPLLDGKPCDVDEGDVFAKGWLTIEADPVPTLLAALGPKMLELAGRLTAGTSVANCGPKTIATHIAPRIVEAAERAGRPAPRIVALVAVCVTDDVEGLLAHGRQQTQMYDTFSSYRTALDREGVASGAELTLAGSIDHIVQGFDAYSAAGATDLRVMIAGRNDDERLATREALAAIIAK